MFVTFCAVFSAFQQVYYIEQVLSTRIGSIGDLIVSELALRTHCIVLIRLFMKHSQIKGHTGLMNPIFGGEMDTSANEHDGDDAAVEEEVAV